MCVLWNGLTGVTKLTADTIYLSRLNAYICCICINMVHIYTYIIYTYTYIKSNLFIPREQIINFVTRFILKMFFRSIWTVNPVTAAAELSTRLRNQRPNNAYTCATLCVCSILLCMCIVSVLETLLETHQVASTLSMSLQLQVYYTRTHTDTNTLLHLTGSRPSWPTYICIVHTI